MTEVGRTGADHVYTALTDAGVDLIIGLPGTQTLPLDRVVARRTGMRYVMARHETAIPHIAWGYHEAGGGMAATLTVPGPGDTNAMHGLKNALDDCVPIVHIAADPDPDHRGKGPIHEIESDTYDTVVKANIIVERAPALPDAVAEALAVARTPPTGPVRLGIPAPVLAEPLETGAVDKDPSIPTRAVDAAYEDAVATLREADRPVIYAGGGLKRAPGDAHEGATAVMDLVETWNAPVFTTYKGKGLVGEDTPQFAGVTASFLPAGGRAILDRADVVLALGTDFDGVTTANWSLPMGEQLVHVTLDPTRVNAAYEADVVILDDAATAASRLREQLDKSLGWAGDELGQRARSEYRSHLRDAGLLDSDTTPATTPATLEAVRAATPETATVVTDIGGHRLWALELFGASGPHRYVTAGSWAGMGVGLPGALGAKLARPDAPVVCLHGDGGLMMCLQELHTAAEVGIPVVVVVFADRDYGIISKDPSIYDGEHRTFAWSGPDFVGIAEGFGCHASRVTAANDAGSAVREAITADRSVPTVVEVSIDGDEPTVKAMADYPSALARSE